MALDDRFRAERNDDVPRPPHLSAEETWRHDADDREGDPVNHQAATDGIGGAVEALTPECMADDGDRAVRPASSRVVALGERSSDEGWDAEHVEEAAAGIGSLDGVLDASRREVEGFVRPCESAIEELILTIPDLLPDRVRPGHFTQKDEAIRLAHG